MPPFRSSSTISVFNRYGLGLARFGVRDLFSMVSFPSTSDPISTKGEVQDQSKEEDGL